MSAFSWPEFAILWGAAVIGIACVTPYTLELTADAINKAQARIHQPRWVLVLLQSAQSVVLMGVATGLGLLIAPRIGLGAPLLEGLLAGKDVTTQALAMIAPALLLGIGTSAVVLALEITVFWPRVPQTMRDTFPIPALWKRLLAGVYGGIDEEILLRLFLLSLLAWLIGFAWHLPGGSPTLGALWLANILAAVADAVVGRACHPAQRHRGGRHRLSILAIRPRSGDASTLRRGSRPAWHWRLHRQNDPCGVGGSAGVSRSSVPLRDMRR